MEPRPVQQIRPTPLHIPYRAPPRVPRRMPLPSYRAQSRVIQRMTSPAYRVQSRAPHNLPIPGYRAPPRVPQRMPPPAYRQPPPVLQCMRLKLHNGDRFQAHNPMSITLKYLEQPLIMLQHNYINYTNDMPQNLEYVRIVENF